MLILVGRFIEGIAESNIVILNKQRKFSVFSMVAIFSTTRNSFLRPIEISLPCSRIA